MNGGQARPLATFPPGVATVPLRSLCDGRPRRAGPNPGAGAGRGPDPTQKADKEVQGRSSRRLRSLMLYHQSLSSNLLNKGTSAPYNL